MILVTYQVSLRFCFESSVFHWSEFFKLCINIHGSAEGKEVQMIEELTQRQMNSILPIKLSERHTILSKGMIFLPGKSNFAEYVLQKQKSAHSVFCILGIPNQFIKSFLFFIFTPVQICCAIFKMLNAECNCFTDKNLQLIDINDKVDLEITNLDYTSLLIQL